MRILHVIPQFPYFGGRTVIGGHASSLLTLALAQADAGDEVLILSTIAGRTGPIEIGPELRAHSLFARTRPGIRFGLRFRREATRWARDRGPDFDVVHSHSGSVDYLVVASRLKHTLGLPTLHTLYCPIPRKGGRARMPVVHGLMQRCAARLDARTAMSRNVARSMKAYGLGAVETVPPPVDLERFRPGDDVADARRELGLDPDHVAVLFVGNAKPQKNMSGTLRAFDAVHRVHPRTRLVVTTELEQSSSHRELADLRQEMSELGLEDVVIQKGIVDDMPRLMQACDVLVAPFLDSFGPSDYFMAALEAMSCGKPVVVSAVGGMPEVVSDDVGRLVNPRDHREIAAMLAVFVDDAERRRSAGRNARSYTERRFNPRRTADRYRDLYQRVAP